MMATETATLPILLNFDEPVQNNEKYDTFDDIFQHALDVLKQRRDSIFQLKTPLSVNSDLQGAPQNTSAIFIPSNTEKEVTDLKNSLELAKKEAADIKEYYYDYTNVCNEEIQQQNDQIEQFQQKIQELELQKQELTDLMISQQKIISKQQGADQQQDSADDLTLRNQISVLTRQNEELRLKIQLLNEPSLGNPAQIRLQKRCNYLQKQNEVLRKKLQEVKISDPFDLDQEVEPLAQQQGRLIMAQSIMFSSRNSMTQPPEQDLDVSEGDPNFVLLQKSHEAQVPSMPFAKNCKVQKKESRNLESIMTQVQNFSHVDLETFQAIEEKYYLTLCVANRSHMELESVLTRLTSLKNEIQAAKLGFKWFESQILKILEQEISKFAAKYCIFK